MTPSADKGSSSINFVRNSNVLLLGVSFLFISTAFKTTSNVQTLIIESAKNKSSGSYVEGSHTCVYHVSSAINLLKFSSAKKGFNGNSYYSLSILYYVGALFNWAAPSFLALAGPKATLITGATTYAMFVASFFHLMDELLYTASFLIGIGAALLWTAQVNAKKLSKVILR